MVTASPPLQAGAATSNITPELGTLIVGGFAPYPARHVHDELHARCLVLDDGETKIALVVCDLLGLHRSVSVEARRLIEEATGIPPGNVLISATHTHSAGTALGKNRYANEQVLDDYQRFVARRIADGVARAVNLLRPAEIAFGTVDIPEYVHNRRWLMREGSMQPNVFGKIDKVRMNPPVFWGSQVFLNDFVAIRELRLWKDEFTLDKPALRRMLETLGDEAAAYLKSVLPEAAGRYPRVIVATHVPPFREAACHEGRPSADDYLPFFACKAVGDVLLEAARSFPDCQVLVLCGHTHGGGEVQVLDNLRVLTGPAEYGKPKVERVLSV